jgi:hypothetical protein
MIILCGLCAVDYLQKDRFASVISENGVSRCNAFYNRVELLEIGLHSSTLVLYVSPRTHQFQLKHGEPFCEIKQIAR